MGSRPGDRGFVPAGTGIWCLAVRGGGKSGLHRAGCQITSGRRESMDSATENIPPVRQVNTC